MKYIRCGYGETHDVNTDMVFVDDVIHEYKHETVDNVEWQDEMTQDEINIMTDACDKASRVCCNCRHNIRTRKDEAHTECNCDIDGHYIGYVECMSGWCRHWSKEINKGV